MLSSISLVFGNFATATTGTANFLPNAYYNDPSQGWFDTTNEVQRSQNATYYITFLLSTRYSNCYERINGSATKSGYQNTLDTLKRSYDNAVVFSKGHRTVININGYNRPGIIPNHNQQSPLGSTSYLLDYEIYPFTSTNNVVTFMWHCQTANNYQGNGVIPMLGGEYYSLPYCFTHNPSMGYYGGTGSQVYLGFGDISMIFGYSGQNGTSTLHPANPLGSPNYEWKMTANNDFGRVAELYWYYMYLGYSSDYALDQVTQAIYGVNFSSSYINGWLVVWGNKYLTLP